MFEVCDNCGDDKEVGVMCDCQEYAVPAATSKYAFNVSCAECGYSGSVELVELHSCAVALNGGRCEDYPCCGHTDGDGCQTLREHTSEFWLDQMRNNPHYDEMDAAGYWDRD